MALKFKSVFTELQMKIIAGEWPEGFKIPTEVELCEVFDVSRVTVRRALDGLVRQGYLTRTRGRGSYVQFHRSLLGTVPSSALKERSNGRYKALVREKLVASSVDIEQFGLHSDDGEQEIWHLRSIHILDGIVTALSDYYVHPTYGSFITRMDEFTEVPFMSLMEAHTGQRCIFVEGRLASILPDKDVASLLGMERSTASLWCRGFCSFADGTIIGRCSKIFNGLFYEFAIEGGASLRLV
jgi:DNA-binding GntR family transcriptional regulator